MKDLVRYRAMESLCRQRAVFRPLESWRLLAEAALPEIPISGAELQASRFDHARDLAKHDEPA